MESVTPRLRHRSSISSVRKYEREKRNLSSKGVPKYPSHGRGLCFIWKKNWLHFAPPMGLADSPEQTVGFPASKPSSGPHVSESSLMEACFSLLSGKIQVQMRPLGRNKTEAEGDHGLMTRCDQKQVCRPRNYFSPWLKPLGAVFLSLWTEQPLSDASDFDLLRTLCGMNVKEEIVIHRVNCILQGSRDAWICPVYKNL